MSLSDTRVLRERKPSRPLPANYSDLYQNQGYSASEQSSAYNSPAPSNWLPDDSSLPYDPNDFGHGTPHYVGDVTLRTYGRGTPPTPSRSDVSITDPRYAGPTHWTRSTSTPRSKPKRPKKVKGDQSKTMMPGDEPVPILSIDCDGPIKDIEAFVHRSVERRFQEVEGKNGYTPRPMNNFMLYRKAYQDKAKKVSSQTNHQVVSQIVAASWKNEPKEIKDKFARYAQIEKEHHIQAFPDYQFRPNKSAKGKKRKPGDFDDDDEASDLEDPDWGRTSSAKRTRQIIQPMHSRNWTPEPQHPFPQSMDPYQQQAYPADYNSRTLYYDQPGHFAYFPMIEHENLGWQYPDQANQHFSTGVPNGMPGSGDNLLDSSNFDNSIFGHNMPYNQSSLQTNNDSGSGPFTQAQFENLDKVPNLPAWEESRPSLDAKTLAVAFQGGIGGYEEDFFTTDAA